MKSIQPNSSHCFVCGVNNPVGLKLRFFTTAPDEVTVETTIPEKYQGYPGVVHGGVVAAILDEAAGRAFLPEGSTRFMYTAHLDIRYRKNVPIGQPLKVIGRAEKSRSRIATACSEIYDAGGNLLAEAKVLLVDVPDFKVDEIDLQALGWKIYPYDE